MRLISRGSIKGNAVALMLGSALEALAPILMVVGLVRVLPHSEIAEVQWFTLLVGIGATLATVGMPQAHMYFVPRLGRHAATIYRRRAACSQLVTGFVALLVAGSIALWSGTLDGPDGVMTSSVTALIGITGAACFTTVRHLAVAMEHGWISMLGSTCMAVLLVVGPNVVAWTSHSPPAIVAAIPAAYLVAAGAVYACLRLNERNGEVGSGSAPSTREILAQSIPLGLTTGASELTRRIDSIVVGHLFSASVFAQYSIGAREVPLVPMVAYSLTQSAIPALTRMHMSGDVAGFLRLWHTTTARAAWLIFPAFIFLWLFSDLLLTTVFTEAFAAAVPVFQTYLLLLPLRLSAYGSILAALGGSRVVSIGAMVGLVSNVVLCLALGAALGWQMVAWASICSQALMIVVYLFEIRRRLGATWWQLIPLLQLARVALLTVVLAPLLLAACSWWPNSLMAAAVCGSAFASAFVWLSLRLGLLQRSELS